MKIMYVSGINHFDYLKPFTAQYCYSFKIAPRHLSYLMLITFSEYFASFIYFAFKFELIFLPFYVLHFF